MRVRRFNPHPGPSTGVSQERCFQSAPRSFDRSVRHGMGTARSTFGFQSAPRSFDRSVPITTYAYGVVSIRTPVLRPECLFHVRRPTRIRLVSIRTPVLRPECPARGSRAGAGFVIVSIRTPVLRPECPLSIGNARRTSVKFQSAPRSFDRSVGHRCTRTITCEDSNVSIRTPVLRPECLRCWPLATRFQSAPRSFDRSVVLSVSRLGRVSLAMFQSAPRSFDRSVSQAA